MNAAAGGLGMQGYTANLDDLEELEEADQAMPPGSTANPS